MKINIIYFDQEMLEDILSELFSKEMIEYHFDDDRFSVLDNGENLIEIERIADKISDEGMKYIISNNIYIDLDLLLIINNNLKFNLIK